MDKSADVNYSGMYSEIGKSHKQFQMYLVQYFKQLLIKLYKYNKQRNDQEERFLQSLSTLLSAYNRE